MFLKGEENVSVYWQKSLISPQMPFQKILYACNKINSIGQQANTIPKIMDKQMTLCNY